MMIQSMPGSSDDHLRQTATETDVIEQNIVMDSGTARTNENIVMDSGTARKSDSIVMGSENARASDGREDQGVLRMDQEERRYVTRGTSTTKIEKQTTSPAIVDR